MRIETYTIGLEVDTSKVAASLKKVNNQISSDLQKTADTFKSRFSGITKSIQANLQKIRLPALIIAGGGIALGKNLIGGASELEESINAINVVFEKGAEKISEFGKTAATTVGLSEKAFNKLSTQTGALLGDVGLSADEAAERTIELTKRAADLASVFDTDVSDAMSAINQAIRGETEAIRRYAGDVTDATLETFLMSKGINKSTKELTQQEKRLYRTELILHQTSKSQGDFTNTSESVANQLRIQGAQVEDLSDIYGKKLLPIMKSILRATGKIIEAFTNLSPETQDLITNIGLAITAFAGVAFVSTFLIPAISAIGAAFALLAANPAILVLTGLGLIVWDLWKAFTGGESVLLDLYNFLKNKLLGAFESIKEKYQEIIELPGKAVNKLSELLNIGDPVKKSSLPIIPTGYGNYPSAPPGNTSARTTTQIQNEVTINESNTPRDTGQAVLEAIQGSADSLVPAASP